MGIIGSYQDSKAPTSSVQVTSALCRASSCTAGALASAARCSARHWPGISSSRSAPLRSNSLAVSTWPASTDTLAEPDLSKPSQIELDLY